MMLKKINMQGLISSLFAFLLTLIFLVLFTCAGFAFGVFNNLSIIRNLNESSYYYEVQKAIVQSAEAAVLKAGLPASVLNDVITVERVYIGEKNYVEAVLNGESADINTDKLHSDLTDSINAYLTKEGIAPSEEISKGTEALISTIEANYKSGIQMGFVTYITEYKSDFYRIMRVLIPILLVLAGVLLFMLIRMHHYKHRGVRYITYALLSSSFMTILIAAYLLLTKQYDKITITPDYYRDFLTSYLKWDYMVFVYVGGIGLIISMALISLISFLKNKITDN